MKLDDLAISRRGKYVVLNHQKYQIEFNLSKGTWNYSDKAGKTIIKNGFTQISLTDGTTLKTLDAGYREFHTEPLQSDAFGRYQTLKFSYETVAANEHRKNSIPNSLSDNAHASEQSSKTQNHPDLKQDSSVKTDGSKPGIGIRIHTYLTCYADHPYILLKVGVENSALTPIGLTNITLIDISAQHGAIQLGGHPTQYNLFLKIPPISPNAGARHKIYDGFSLNGDKTLLPCQDGILHDTDSKKSFVFGFITTNKWWPRIKLGYQVSKSKSQQGLTTWSLYHDCENMECQSGEVVTSEIGYLEFSEDAQSSYKRYTERQTADCAEQAQRNTLQDCSSSTTFKNHIPQNTFTGWSFSLENMPGKLGADTIKEEISSIANSPLFKPTLAGGIEYIHLERGWQPNPGTLSLNRESFPDGMVPVVEQIHTHGFKAGICIDPFVIESKSNFVKKHPDACLLYKNSVETKSDNGKPSQVTVNQPIEVHLPGREFALAILDVSHPETQKHVRKVIKQLVDEWGYDLIKADLSSYTCGMMSIAQNAKWHDTSLTSTELYRLAVRLLAEAVEAAEKEAILAGYNVIESVCIGSFMLNYPLLRQKYVDNSDPWHQQNGTKHRLSRYTGYLNAPNIGWNHVYGDLSVDDHRPVNEAIVEMTAAALSGDAVLCVNTPTTLSTLRAELIAKLFPLSGVAARSVDHYEETFPRIWHLPIETAQESWNLLGIFNWKDQQDDVHLNLESIGLNSEKDYLVHDFWMRQYVGIVSKNVTLLNMAPRTAKLLCFREQQQIPQLLSTDIHYTQGSVEILSAGWDNYSQSYLIICQPPRQSEGTFFVHVPEDYIPIGVSTLGSEYQYSWDKPIYQLSFSATDSLIHASIQFMKTTGGSMNS